MNRRDFITTASLSTLFSATGLKAIVAGPKTGMKIKCRLGHAVLMQNESGIIIEPGRLY